MSQTPQALPPGWAEKFTKDGKRYYVDFNTKTTHWTLPEAPAPVEPTLPAYLSGLPPLTQTQQQDTEQLPAGWGKKQTPDGRTYYVDYSTKTTHWSLPDNNSPSPSPPGSPATEPNSKKKQSPANARTSGTISKRQSSLRSISKPKITLISRSSSGSASKSRRSGNNSDLATEAKLTNSDNSIKNAPESPTPEPSPTIQIEMPDKFSHLQNLLLQGDVLLALELFEVYDKLEIDSTGKTLLHYVALGSTKVDSGVENLIQFVDAASALKEAGVDVNAQDVGGNTAFHLAVGSGPPDLIYWFIAHAELKPNKQEKTPLMLAEEAIANVKGMKEDKKKLKRADGALALAGKDNLFNFKIPKNFHCTERFSLRTALMMALLAKLIYKGEGADVGEEFSPGNVLLRAVLTRWGFSSIKIFEKNDARGMLLEKEETKDMPRVYVIAFRGTKTKKDILTDLSANKRGGGTTHAGFQTHVNRISDAIIQEMDPNATWPIYVTGHSLGGAMSTLMMKKLHTVGYAKEQLHMYTFGQPRAGTNIFQTEFDSLFKNAYIIQRNLDPVPLVPTFSGMLVGGYVHSGSLRFLDSAGQLYNDLHYQYEDINRAMMESLPKDRAPTAQELRMLWTSGLQQLNQHVSVSENSTDIEALGFTDSESESAPDVPQKTSKARDTNVVFNMIKGRKEALMAHGMLGYVTDIALLESRINKSFSWEDPENAITSQLSNVTLPLDVYSEDIKGERYRREREVAYQHWIQHYVSLPGIQKFLLDSSITCENIIPWIHQEGKVLQQISLIEESILTKCPNLNQPKNIPKLSKRENVSPLVEVGMYSIINMLSEMMKENEDLGMTYYRWLYLSMPETGYSLKSTPTQESCTLEHGTSPYRQGIQSCLKNLSTREAPLDQLAVSLPAIVKVDNGPKIAKISTSIQRMREECIKVRHEARVELSNLEYAIVGEMIAKFKKVGMKAGAYCAASGAVGAAAGIATGLAVVGVTGGAATPAAIIAGLAVGAGTTGTLLGVAAAKKVPKYLESIKNSLVSYEKNLLGYAEATSDVERNKHKSSILKICSAHQSRSRVVLYLINGLYINLALAKLQHVNVLNAKGNSGSYIERQQETFFRKVLSLINLYIAVVKFDDEKVNSHLEILSRICKAIEKDDVQFRRLFIEMGQKLNVQHPAVGPDIYRRQADAKKSMGTLIAMITDQNNPKHQAYTLGGGSTRSLPAPETSSSDTPSYVSSAPTTNDAPSTYVPAYLSFGSTENTPKPTPVESPAPPAAETPAPPAAESPTPPEKSTGSWRSVNTVRGSGRGRPPRGRPLSTRNVSPTAGTPPASPASPATRGRPLSTRNVSPAAGTPPGSPASPGSPGPRGRGRPRGQPFSTAGTPPGSPSSPGLPPKPQLPPKVPANPRPPSALPPKPAFRASGGAAPGLPPKPQLPPKVPRGPSLPPKPPAY